MYHHRRLTLLTICLLLLSFLAACGGEGMAVAPELIDADAITARAFGAGECFVTLPEDVPARFNPDPEQVPAGEIPAGEVEAVQVVTLRDDGGLWYQLAIDGMWVRVDTVDYTTRGDCRP